MSALDAQAFVVCFGVFVALIVAFWDAFRLKRDVDESEYAGGLIVLVVAVVASVLLRACMESG